VTQTTWESLGNYVSLALLREDSSRQDDGTIANELYIHTYMLKDTEEKHSASEDCEFEVAGETDSTSDIRTRGV
jgi:hypothetical protein